MSAGGRIVRVAAVQTTAALLHRSATLERVDRWTADAAATGASIVAFPETFVPGYPAWLDHSPRAALWGEPAAKEVFAQLHENAVEVPGPATERLSANARKHGVTLVIGVHEIAGRSLYNSLLTFGPDGALANRHRKLVPTYTERLVWAQGDPHGLRAVAVPVGGGGSATVRLGGLICWEHWMPLARQALHDAGEQIHVAAWPGVHEMHRVASRHYAFEGRCFVIAVGSLLRAGDLPVELPPALGRAADESELLLHGGSCILGPDGRYLAGPVYDEETIVVADCDLREIARESLTLDVSGHYARPDVFEFRVREAAGAGAARAGTGRPAAPARRRARTVPPAKRK